MSEFPDSALVLVGGLGTRLRALYPDRPKALVPVAGQPFLVWMMRWLAHQGIRQVHLAAGYRGEMLADWAGTAPLPLRLTCSVEPRPLGTGGGARYAIGQLEAPLVWVLNGDSLLPQLDLAAQFATFAATPVLATLAVTAIETPGRYGTVDFDEHGRVRAFLEKIDRPRGYVNGGVYLLRREVLESLPPDEDLSLERSVFPDLAQRHQMSVARAEPPLLDMGTPEGLAAMEAYLDRHGERFQ